jgi:DNA modification methylase
MQIIHGDCLERLKKLQDNSIDAVVTDPPYGISFMGKKWDYDVPSVEVWEECLRVLKPGGHALIACGTRTQHRMAVNIEDAGFEIRDVVTWLYGSGFPKSMNLKGDQKGWGTALKPACEFWTLARKPLEKGLTVAQNVQKWGTGAINVDGCRVGTFNDGAARSNTPGAGRMKPGGSPIGTFERSSSSGPLDENQGRWPANLILDEGAGRVMDEDAGSEVSRFFKTVESDECKTTPASNAQKNSKTIHQIEAVARTFFALPSAAPFIDLASRCLAAPDAGSRSKDIEANTVRDLANQLLKTESLLSLCLGFTASHNGQTQLPSLVLSAALLESIGTITTTQDLLRLSGFVSRAIESIITSGKNDPSFASAPRRFAYIPKASKSERNKGLEGMPLKSSPKFDGGDFERGNGNNAKDQKSQNFHPTVKPIKLMSYLCRLITPPGGAVLDPFMGSGSTGVAAKKEGFKFVGIELSAEYLEIAKKRIASAHL